ncbi:MAG: tRNA (N6-isopentenyl adenosine(37)-C2)-methylthiotransferase MiaB [Oscillospiraceae bacterium]|nr:tRNA (N6-isopentenyl adenosine(37)-C2)-methylthiotransferase MiaB [Oscillospiraceae bacterium]
MDRSIALQKSDFSDKNFLEKQDYYLNLISELMDIRKRGEKPLAFIHTYGCQQNVADSEKIKGMLYKAGFDFTDKPDDADFILFNTCAVREHAEDRVFGNVGALKNLKRKHPQTLIALCGCMMEQKHIADRMYKSFPFVSLVFGTHSLQNFPELYYRTLFSGKRVYERDNDDKLIYEGIPVKRDGTFKSWLPIMYGCDNFCTYCIVPYVRGRERSRKKDDVINEARELINSGYKDITLLGQNVNSYGKGLEEKTTFAQLIGEIDQIEGDYWLRFMTSHPKDCSKELIDTIANGKHISKHLHLPFQSGSDRVLKQMNRHYDRKKYLEIINYAKERIPDVSLTSDIIVGFPGETYEDFKETLSLIKEVKFTSLFTFIYSPRVGTPAAEMADPISAEEKSKWFRELLAVQEEIAAKRCASMVGNNEKILVESVNEKNGKLQCRNSGNIIVECEGSSDLIGTFQTAKITEARNWILRGKIV